MACNPQLYGKALDCAPTVGGLKGIYVFPADWVGDNATGPVFADFALANDQAKSYGYPSTNFLFSLLFTVNGWTFEAIDPSDYEDVEGHATPVAVYYELPKGIATLTHTATVDPSTGVQVIENVITIPMGALSKKVLLELNGLLGGEFGVAAVLNTGEVALLGVPMAATTTHLRTTPMKAKALEASPGAAMGDANRGTITLSCFSNLLPPYGVEDLSFMLVQNQ